MVFEFKFPDVGEGIYEGKLVKWLVKEGDVIKADQAVLEVETDKAVVELPSPQAGIVLKLYFKEGDVVRVGQVAYAVGEQGEIAREITQENAPEGQKAPVPARPQAAPAQFVPAPLHMQAPAPGSKAIATPATRKFAADMGVNIDLVAGTGPGGRVTIEDIKAHAAGTGPASPSAVSALQSMPGTTEDYGPVERVKISSLRKAIAEKMVKSASTIPHVTHMEEVGVGALVQLREGAKDKAAAKGVKLTYLPFIIKAVVGALKDYPQFNARYDAEKLEIVLRKYYNIGIATDTEDGLLVPVIHDADKKDLMTLALEISAVTEEARKRRLKLMDMQGGTFTITNIGSTGGVWATPIINYPEVAILGVMKMKDRPAVVEGNVVSRKMMNLVLSFDHRVVDGAVAARFMNSIVKRLEDPTLL